MQAQVHQKSFALVCRLEAGGNIKHERQQIPNEGDEKCARLT